jgi:hypothetical protein
MTYGVPSDESLEAMDQAMVDRVARHGGYLTQKECSDLLAYHVGRAQEVLAEQETLIATLEKENRKLNDKLNRFRNMTPGRKRLHTLGRVGAVLELEGDEIRLKAEARDDDPASQTIAKIEMLYADANAEDALYLHRLQWDLEQLREVVYPSDTPSHEWRRP